LDCFGLEMRKKENKCIDQRVYTDIYMFKPQNVLAGGKYSLLFIIIIGQNYNIKSQTKLK